jgi:ankyrin repeat protein
MEIEVLLELIELILTQKDSAEAFAGAISQGKFCFPYFDYLLSEGFLPDGVALLAATKMRQIEIVRFVLKSGVRPTLEAFQYAAEHEFFELCNLFVEFGSREILSTPELEEELISAIMDNLQKTVINLINQGINVVDANDEDDDNANNNQSIKLASEFGYTEIVRLLLKHGADPTAQNNYAIKWASREGHTEVVRLLLEYGADPTASNNRSIIWASEEGHLEVVRLLLDNNSKYKVDPTAVDNYAIKNASGKNKFKIVKLLEQYRVRH